MKVTQVTVFLENRSGRLAEVAEVLGRAGIDIRGFSTTEAAEYGIVRLIVHEPEQARELLRQAGFTTQLSNVLCVRVPDEPGGLAAVLDELAERGVEVEHLYSVTSRHICVAVSHIDRAIEMLSGRVGLLSTEEVCDL